MEVDPPAASGGLTLDRLVVERGLAPAETLARASLVQAETGEPLDTVLTRLGLVSEKALAAAIAEAAGLRIAQASDFPAEPIASERLSSRFCAISGPFRFGRRTPLWRWRLSILSARSIAMPWPLR